MIFIPTMLIISCLLLSVVCWIHYFVSGRFGKWLLPSCEELGYKRNLNATSTSFSEDESDGSFNSPELKLEISNNRDASISPFTTPLKHPVSIPGTLIALMMVFAILAQFIFGIENDTNVTLSSVKIMILINLVLWFIIISCNIIFLELSFNIFENTKKIIPYFFITSLSQLLHYIKSGFMLFLFVFSPVIIVTASTFPLRDPSKINPLLKFINKETDLSTIIWVYIAAAISAPLAEELVFRYSLQSLFTRILKWAGVITVAVIFGLVHGIIDAVPLIPLAVIFGFHFYYRGEYYTVVFAHAFFNIVMLTSYVLGIKFGN